MIVVCIIRTVYQISVYINLDVWGGAAAAGK